MTPDSHHRRFGPVMWGAIGALVLICLAVCGAAFWLDAWTARTTERIVEQLRRPSNY